MFNPSEISTLYVSKKIGDDNHNFGFSAKNKYLAEGPVETLEKALSYVAELRNDGRNQPITIYLMDEEYDLSAPIVLNPLMHSITIKPYTKTLISGGIKITDFKKDTFNGQDCFSAYIPEVAEGNLWFTDFYVDGKRANVTRYPESGTLEPESVGNEDTDLVASCEWFIAKKEDLEKIATFKNFGDCFISYNHYWIDEHSPIKSYDLNTGRIDFEYASRFSLSSKHGRSALHYIIENVAESFKNPNEWYLDRETSTVYYIPENSDQTPENITAYAPVTDKLFILEGSVDNKLKNVRLDGLQFAYTKGDYKSLGSMSVDTSAHPKAADPQSVHLAHGSVELFNTHGCYIENCEFFCLGVHALTVNDGCTLTRINRNNIYDIGAGGIKISGVGYGEFFGIDIVGSNINTDVNKKLENHSNSVTNNRIDKCGRRYFAGCGILVKHSYNNHIAHNEISNLFYTGISLGWIWGYADSISHDNLVEKNLIYNIGSGVLSDMGGIYTLGKQPGTIIRNNIIHDVNCFDYGAWGIYTDEGSSYITVENNLCYNLGRNGFHQHYGRMNTVRNNIFVKSGQGAANVSGTRINNNAIFERNILVTQGDQPTYLSMYGDESAPNNIIAHNNLLFNVDGKVKAMGQNVSISLEEFQKDYGNDKYSIEADPMFVDYENNDFRLKEGSPAYSIGFEDIDFSDVGIIK